MFPGPFTELYVEARLRDRDRIVLTAPTSRSRAPGWKQRAARSLVRLALELDAEQVRVARATAPA
jgi:hypothetical protein